MIEFYEAMESLNKKKGNDDQYVIEREPTNETEYAQYVKFVSGNEADGMVIFSDTPYFTWSEVMAEKALLQTEYEKNQYQRDRVKAYPSLEEQMDMQYWDSINGTTTWKDKIAEIKALYPKPTENN